MKQLVLLTTDLNIVMIETHAQSFWLTKVLPKVGDIFVAEECQYLFSSDFDEAEQTSSIVIKAATKRDEVIPETFHSYLT